MDRISIISLIILQIWTNLSVNGLVQGDLHYDNTIREIVVRHEEALGHADRFRPDLKHNLPVVRLVKYSSLKYVIDN